MDSLLLLHKNCAFPRDTGLDKIFKIQYDKEKSRIMEVKAMNRTVFKQGLIWNNIGEVAVILGKIDRSVYQSALLQKFTARSRVHLSLFK